MPIEVKVRDFRGCERADISIAPIALVGGRNAAGKTSLAQAVGAALTGQAIPVARALAAGLVRSTQRQGSATIESEAGSTRVSWPGSEVTGKGKPPAGSLYAAGLRTVCDMHPADRTRILAEYLKAEPTKGDLGVALNDAGIWPNRGGAPLDEIWQLIEAQGWDAAHSVRREHGAQLKGGWRQITQTNYGSRIAADWRPDLADETATDEELSARVDNALRDLEQAIGSVAVGAEHRARLEARAATVDECEGALREAQDALLHTDAALTEAKEVRALLPASVDTLAPEVACPHCGAFVVIRRSLLEVVLEPAPTDRPDEAELKRRRLAIADADGTLSRLTAESGERERALRSAKAALEVARTSASELEALPPATEAPNTEAQRTALRRAEQRLLEVRAKRKADSINRQIEDNDTLLGILAPDGLRARKLGRVVEAFNEARLAPLCDAAGWAAVAVDADLGLSYGGRPYQLLSASEQYRVRVVMQVAMAQLDGSSMVIIDGADILDAGQRGGLFQMLQDVEMPALVLVTLARQAQLPDLEAAGIGASYWISDGIAAPLVAQEVAA